ncbi:hypothetical protein DBV05_g10335 [Lasiodiplodia theobromae]|uniref:Uncharacterized protein n=1 Tax=Lasiodiplodia theobromae TaxID=45133 RepID=A0A5N5D099_9PEZI|nr:hypothetical protein DBV05_g10335 [Lasiodiplodia theobromae]
MTDAQKQSFNFLPFTTAAFILCNIYYWWLQYTVVQRLKKDRTTGWNDEAARRKVFMLVNGLCSGNPCFLHTTITAAPNVLKILAHSLSILTGSQPACLRLCSATPTSSLPRVDIAIVIVCCREPANIVHAVLHTDYPPPSSPYSPPTTAADPSSSPASPPSRSGTPPATSTMCSPGSAGPTAAAAAAAIQHPSSRAWMPTLYRSVGGCATIWWPSRAHFPANGPLSQSLIVFQRFEEVVKDRAGFPCCTDSG